MLTQYPAAVFQGAHWRSTRTIGLGRNAACPITAKLRAPRMTLARALLTATHARCVTPPTKAALNWLCCSRARNRSPGKKGSPSSSASQQKTRSVRKRFSGKHCWHAPPPCLSNSKHHAACMGNGCLGLTKLSAGYMIFSQGTLCKGGVDQVDYSGCCGTGLECTLFTGITVGSWAQSTCEKPVDCSAFDTDCVSCHSAKVWYRGLPLCQGVATTGHGN